MLHPNCPFAWHLHAANMYLPKTCLDCCYQISWASPQAGIYDHPFVAFTLIYNPMDSTTLSPSLCRVDYIFHNSLGWTMPFIQLMNIWAWNWTGNFCSRENATLSGSLPLRTGLHCNHDITDMKWLSHRMALAKRPCYRTQVLMRCVCESLLCCPSANLCVWLWSKSPTKIAVANSCLILVELPLHTPQFNQIGHMHLNIGKEQTAIDWLQHPRIVVTLTSTMHF